ncbi:MAG: aminotransferase class I/II-fold pyridoxal phosphate-dependent enzyme, partial [Kangiellaceae bacterium]|nr:aminotransferase class I/II-fold pyridoxal phosphate-dependent enzyme [Kangiellaceae bacterium]
FSRKRDEVMQTMELLKGIICPKPQGAFYAFPDISSVFGKRYQGVPINNDVDFAEKLLEAKGVAVVPGSAFGESRAIRISYACKPNDLTEGLKRFSEFVNEIG